MKFDRSFIVLMTLVLFLPACLGAVFFEAIGNRTLAVSVFASGLSMLVNQFLSYIAIEWGFPMSHTKFLKIILIGSVVRLALLISIVIVLIKILQFDPLSFMLSLLVFYALNLVLEIYYLQKKVALKV
ncbi:MAG: hypothetical protein V1799_00915 [bacterium]